MPTYTRQAVETIVLMRIGSGDWAANDAHLTIGRGDGSASTWIGRAELRFPEPDWPDGPAAGKLVKAILTVEESDTSQHSTFRGSSQRLWVKRMSAKARFSLPSHADGHGSNGYTQQGTGDKYPGGAVAGSEVEFNVRGRTSRDVSSIIEQMLPGRIKKRNGTAGNNELYGYFQLRSSDEDSASRSMVLARRVTLAVTIDTRVTPAETEILEVVGAQEEGGSEPTLVASDDGRTLEIRFGFSAGLRDTAAKAELELRVAGATDAVPGALIRSSGNVPPLPGGGTNIYRAKLSGIPVGSEGKWRLRATSSSGKQGPWTSLDEADAHVRLVVIPGAPVDIVVQPFIESPNIQASLPSTHPGTISGMEARVTLLPQGRVWDSGIVEIGGSVRRATIVYEGETLGDGQQTSTVVRLRDEDLVVGRYSGPVVQTHRVTPDVTVSPAPSRLTTRRPTITLGFPLADGAKIRLLHETDDEIILYDGPATPLVDQTSNAFVIPADTLTWGQRFRVQGAFVPNGGGTTYGEYSTAVGPYSIASLPTSSLSVPDAIGHRVPVEDVEWLRTVSDPDGAALDAIEQEIRVADTPQGDGALVIRAYDSSAETLTTIEGGEVTYETSVDVRVRAYNDSDDLLATTLSGAHTAGDATPTLASETGVTVGMTLVFASAVAGETESGEVASLGPLTLTAPLQFAHGNTQVVTGRAPGPWSPWTTWDALEPPSVDLLTPLDDAVISVPTQEMDWSTTPNGSRTTASAELRIYDADSQIIATVELDDSTSIADIPPFVLEDATAYQWDVTATDSEGMYTTSARRDFTTTFVEMSQLAVVSAEAGESGMVVSWDEVLDVELNHIEVSWQADDGTWIRIDGGPEELGDDAEPFTGTTLTHIGARLGANTYAVSPHNGWRAAQPTTVTETLGWSDVRRGAWEVVTGEGALVPLNVTDAPFSVEAQLDMAQPPGASNRALSWGVGAQRISMRIQYLPLEDGSLATRLRQLMADPSRGRASSPAWVRSPAGYLLDPAWCELASMSATPMGGGLVDSGLDWVEVGEPVYAILPPVAEEPAEGVPDLVSDLSEIDFGEVTE